jgi:hypothetical protein
MPIAQKFNADGVGNGFPTCLTKVDVSEYDYWTTLSGVSKDSPATSDALIAESLQLAMKLFWNFNGCSADTAGDGGGFDPFSYSVTIDMDDGIYDLLNFQGYGFSSDENKTPRERVCYHSYGAYYGDLDLGVEIDIIRMYNGVTTSEDNFVGHGVGGYAAGFTGRYIDLTLSSYYDPDTDITEVHEYVIVDDLHFVAGGWSSISTTPTDPVITSDESSVTASTSNGANLDEVSTIRLLDFYTY